MNHFKRAHYRQLTTHIFYLEKFSLAGRAINGTSRNFTVLELFIDTMLKGHLNTVIRHDIWIYLVVWPPTLNIQKYREIPITALMAGCGAVLGWNTGIGV